jgi:EAL domain-containing protein (putative c-di-GMP-specific phosphodiesterase class I)/CheY-like chemotaxis protein
MRIADLNFLIVEDNAFQRRWLAIMLTKLGAQHIDEAADGQAALKRFENKDELVDICFIDLNMPGMDGMELIRHMAKEDTQASVILTSALSPSLLFSVSTMSKAYGINLIGTIEKPVTPEILQTLIGQYQRSHSVEEKFPAGVPTFSFDDIMDGLEGMQFEPFFQPYVELATGKVKGVEGLARWRHPQYGVLPPSTFISVLEENGHINVLSWMMIGQSAAACRKWHDLGFPLAVSLNLATSSLTEPRLAEQVVEHMSGHGLEAHDITFEITEAAAMTEDPQCLENLVRLRMKGFGLSVDGDGTSHANLQQLLRIPFSDLKINRSFVAGASQNKSMALALNTCLEFSRKLNRPSVAVGVETKEDWDFLLQVGCTYAQGYYIAKPMEVDAVPNWIEEWAHFF